MCDMGMDAAVAEQSQQVQRSALLQAGVHGGVVALFSKKIAVFDGFADAGQVLKYHAAAADVGVAHLAVAHLSFGQTHV